MLEMVENNVTYPLSQSSKWWPLLQNNPVPTTQALLLPIIVDIKPSKIEIQNRNAFSRFGTELWKKISGSLRELPKKSFKLIIKNKLLVLEDEDSVIEVHKIISELKYQ